MRTPRSATEPRLLEGVDYPVDKSELLKRADSIAAPSSVKDAIRRLPDATFRSRADLIAAVETIAAR